MREREREEGGGEGGREEEQTCFSWSGVHSGNLLVRPAPEGGWRSGHSLHGSLLLRYVSLQLRVEGVEQPLGLCRHNTVVAPVHPEIQVKREGEGGEGEGGEGGGRGGGDRNPGGEVRALVHTKSVWTIK